MKSFFSYNFIGDSVKRLVLILILLLFPINVYSLSASSVTVMDMDTKRVLYSYNQNDVRLIASISKIMTSLVTLNNSNIKDMVTIDESVLKSYGSGIYVEVGEGCLSVNRDVDGIIPRFARVTVEGYD